jgi:uncharacterized membrane protein YhhN
MSLPGIIFFALFVLASVVNVTAGFLEQEKLRKISKPFCLFFLSLAVIFFVPAEPLIYIGAICGLIGDIILLNKDSKISVGLGSGVFLVGHVLYISEALSLIFEKSALPPSLSTWLWMGLYAVLLLAASFYPIFRLTKHSPIFTPLGMLYSSILISDGAVAILGCAVGLSQYFFLMILGDVFFILSDSLLSYTIFVKDVKRRDFYIMLTYLLGQALILSGLVFTALR